MNTKWTQINQKISWEKEIQRDAVGALGNSQLCPWRSKNPLHSPLYLQRWGFNKEQLTPSTLPEPS